MADYKDFGLVLNQTQAVDAQWTDDVTTLSDISIQTEWTGTVVGVLTLKGRNHPSLQWQTISQVAFAQPAGSPGGEIWFIESFMAKYVLLDFDFTSGTGSMKVAINAKDGG